MKKLFENFRKYTLTEELTSQFMTLHEKQGNKLAKAQKELEMIKKDPKAYIQQRTAKLQKKVGKGGGGKEDAEGGEGGEVKDALLDKIKGEAGEQKKDAQKAQQVDQLGDQAMAQAKKDPEQKANLQKIASADKAVTYIMDLVKEVRDKIFKQFKDAMAKGDQAKMKERYDYYVRFGDFTAKFINEAVEAFKKGKEDPKQYDEVIAMAAKYGFKG